MNVVLSANTAEFTTKLESAAKKTKSFGQSLGGRDDMLKWIGLSSGSITALSTGVTAATEVAHVFAEAGREVAEVVVRIAETIGEWIAQSTEAIDAATKMAGSLGISTEAFMSLGAAAQKEANVGSEQFVSVLLKMSKTLGEASIKGGDAEDTLTRLGLSIKLVSSLPVDKQFTAIADAISRLPSPMEKAVAATSLFGKEGGRLLPLLDKGAAGIEELRQQAIEYGAAVRQFDAGSISNMKDQLEEIQMKWTGIKNTLTIALAPAISGIATLLSQAIPPANELRADFESALYYVAATVDSLGTMGEVLAMLAANHPLDAFNLAMHPETTFVDFVQLVSKASDAAARNIHKIPAAIGDAATNSVEAAKSIQASIDAIKVEAATAGMNRLNKTLTELLIKGHVSAKQLSEVASAIIQIEAAAQAKRITDFLDGLKTDAALTGLEGMAKVMRQLDLMQAPGWAKKLAKDYQDSIDQAKTLVDWAERIKKEHEDAETPLDKYLARMREINEEVGIGLNLEIARRAAAKAYQELQNSYKSNDPGVISAREVRFGQMPAVPSRQDPSQAIVDAVKAAKATEDRQLAEQQLTNRLLRDNGIAVFDIGQ